MRGDRPVGSMERGIDPDRLSFLLESSNPVMVRAINTARQVASFEIPVLLTGETGTGKSILAAAMHRWGGRGAGPFVTVSCSAPERADRQPIRPAPYGTLFLDEVGMLSSAAQAKLIRFLDEERSGNPDSETTAGAPTRVIAATTHDLEKDVQAGRFRQDLFFRLNVVTIRLPALRERREDISRLTVEILVSLCVRHRRAPVELPPEVRGVLAAYAWRGNLRELATVLEHAIVLAPATMIQLTDLPERLLSQEER